MRPLTQPSGVAKPALRGFTLIELLVAITVMALIAILSWRRSASTTLGMSGYCSLQATSRPSGSVALPGGCARRRQSLPSAA